ncbi:MAG: hypothetical protein ACOY40_09110 [Bacillota bacterium]
MKIEILTRSADKKPDIMTYLRSLKGFQAYGGKALAEGLEAEITGSYIYLSTSIPWMADELLKKLFTVRPVPFAPAFYEIAGDIKIIATCQARPINEIITALDVLEHLDLEYGELAGRFETAWSSRDVGVTAEYTVMVQGGVAVAKVKFKTHFRESEFHCRNLLNTVSVTRGLSVLTGEEKDFAKPARMSPVALTASITLEHQDCALFLNRCPGRVRFMEESGEFRVELPGGNNCITLSGKNEKSAQASIYLEKPWHLGAALILLMAELLKLDSVEISRTITGLVLSPDDLLHRLGFVKDRGFFRFKASMEGLEACYDIARRQMDLKGTLPWNEVGDSGELFARIEEFTNKVMGLAV